MDFLRDLRDFFTEMWPSLLVILIPVVMYVTVAFVAVHFILKYW